MSTQHEERWRPLYEAGRPIVFLLWHEVLLPLLWHHRGQGVVIVVSENRDGQYLSDFARVLGYRSIRGSSSKGRGAGPARCRAGAAGRVFRGVYARTAREAPVASSSRAWWPPRSGAGR